MKIIKEFLEYRKAMKIEPIMSLPTHLLSYISSAKGEKEREINQVVLGELAKLIMKEDVSGEFARGFKSALQLRASLVGKNVLAKQGIDNSN